jgi:hypothetical protein
METTKMFVSLVERSVELMQTRLPTFFAQLPDSVAPIERERIMRRHVDQVNSEINGWYVTVLSSAGLFFEIGSPDYERCYTIAEAQRVVLLALVDSLAAEHGVCV